MRRDLHRGVHSAACGAANQQWDFAHAKVIVFLHFAGDVLHFFQAWCDQTGQADDVRTFHLGAREDIVAGHHHAHVDHVKVIALKHDSDNVFTDVVHIAFDRGNHNLALGFHFFASGFLLAFFFFDVGNQMRDRLLHDARAFHHLR